MNPTWIEIDAGALSHNINLLKDALNQNQNRKGNNPFPSQLGVVLKANAYGHGLWEVYRSIYTKVDAVYLTDPKDAKELYDKCHQNQVVFKPCWVLGWVDSQWFSLLASLEIGFVVSDFSQLIGFLNSVTHATKPPKILIHLDTGLGREGFLPSQVSQLLSFLEDSQHQSQFQLSGWMSHFANVEDVTDQAYALQQLKSFEEMLSQLPVRDSHCLHMAATAATMLLAESHQSVVRCGIGLYGYWPSVETKLSYQLNRSRLQLDQTFKPALSWYVKAQLFKTLPEGSYVGYGCTHRCEKETTIALLPVGYFDGYPRLCTQKAYVLFQGKRCPVLGRIMMNHMIVDVSHVDTPCVTSLFCLIGHQGTECISANELARWSESISYEILARLGSHIPRLVKKS
jgi:alanine racemase